MERAEGDLGLAAFRPNVQPLAEQIYFWLKERIILGELKPGERLSVEQLAAGIGVSRTPVRDAINRLALEGILVVHPRRGTLVGALSVHDIRDVYQIRSFLEPAVAEYAAEHATESLMTDLNALQAEWEQLDPAAIYRDLATTNRYVEINAEFHRRLAAQTGNARLQRIVQALYIQPRIATVIFGSDYQGPLRRMAEHRQIIAAIRERNGPAAAQAMRAHLQAAASDLIGFLTTLEEQGEGRSRSPLAATLPRSTS
ncbi:MAG: GntR family transcriptional regulator [Dehalococcoidia bacterium]|nr:MAG: GntR family transcriptional regulator [Dehalococcoidia bacterium]